MDSAILSLLGAFLLSIIGLFVFIWSLRKGLLVENPRAASVIFAPGELGKVDDPAIHGNSQERLPGAAAGPGEGEHVAEMGGAGHIWLHLQADCSVPMVCQRCLEVAEIALHAERSFRFVKDEATAEVLDDEAEEDLLAISKDFNLRELIEDELLMELPLVPMHEVCPAVVPMASSDEDFEQAVTEKTNPFAVLAGLRKNGGQD